MPRSWTRRPGLHVTVAAIGLVLLSGAPEAHLSIIRQGAETAGANEAGDGLGGAVAVGDFDGNGFDDLAMGAPYEDVGTTANAGAVAVNYADGLGVSHEDAQIWTAAEMTGPVQQNAFLGYSLAAADLDQDGFEDLIVGAPYETIGGNFAAGAFYVLRGSALGLQPWLRRDQADFGSGTEYNDRFGWSVVAGNWNGDAYPDVAVGAPGENDLKGAVIWVLSTASGPVGSSTHIDLGHAGVTPSAGEQLGFSLAAGDVMGGPEDEVIIGVPYMDDAGFEYGAIVVTPGSPSGPDRSASILYRQDQVSPGGSQRFSQFGRSVAAGRLMGGGYDAVAVGAPFHNVGGTTDAGQVVVVPGSAGGLDVSGAIAVTDAATGGVAENGDNFGLAVEVGYFWDPADGYEDLAVGAPGQDFTSIASAGTVQILNGGPGGPTGAHGWSAFNQGTLNEYAEDIDQLGASLAFGYFDISGNGNLAVGAPGEDDGAGMVHVIAPWRQVYNLSCERSVVLDCDQNLYFSQKPFDQVLIASTTKIMTVALALEWAAMGEVSLDDVYVVPGWVANDNIPGSKVPLEEGESITLRDLIYTCLMLSGNDAAYAIADHIMDGKGPDDPMGVPNFITLMNHKAGLIGMNDTHFNNPAGLEVEPVGPDLGEHYSTPQDMATLSSWAMGTGAFRDVAGTTRWEMVRQFIEFPHYWEFNNIFNGVLMNGIEPMSGIKGGYTNLAGTTGCFAAESPTGGRAIATSFTTPNPPDDYVSDAARLVQLGLQGCGYFYALPDDYPVNEPFDLGDISSGDGVRTGASSAIPAMWEGDMEFSAFRTAWGGSDPSSMDLCITHRVEIAGAVAHDLGATNLTAHGPITITNRHPLTAIGQITLPYGVEDIVLEPGETLTLPERSDGWASFPIEIRTFGDDYLEVDVVIPYCFDVSSTGPPHGDPVFQATLLRDVAIPQDAIEVRTLGHDAEANLYSLVGHAPGAVVDVSEDVGDATVGDVPLVRLRAAHPNPFRSGSRIGFDLHSAGAVGVEIYDVSGRLVRSYDPVAMTPGAWGVRWDGRAEAGLPVAAGTYLYHVTVDGEVAAMGKMVRID